MQIKISSGEYTAAADTHGAELVSFKSPDNTEYIWQADPDVWQRHAPVLFPFVCSTHSKTYTVNGVKYKMSNHGFARDSEFEVLSQTDSSVTFVLKANDATKALYPYDFEFCVTYELNESKLSVTFSAANKGSGTMYCFIGGHPGFNCPLTEGETFEDYSVKYEKAETVVQNLADKTVTIADNTDTVSLTRELFANDVFMKQSPNSSEISLISGKSGRGVTFSYDKSGCIAVWSPYNEKASFVCLEPWTSVPIYCEDTEELTEMKNAVQIPAGGKYDFKFDIDIF